MTGGTEPPSQPAVHWDMRKNLLCSATEIWGLFVTPAVLLILTNTEKRAIMFIYLTDIFSSMWRKRGLNPVWAPLTVLCDCF